MPKKPFFGGRWLLLVALVLGLTLGLIQPARAAEFIEGGVIGADQVIDDDVFISAENVSVDGTVNGILFATGNTVTLNGVVNGDAFLAGNQIIVSDTAKISGNLFTAGQTLVVGGEIQGSIFGGGAAMVVREGAQVGRNLYFGGFSLEAQPATTVAHSLYAGGYQVMLQGEVTQDVKLSAGAVELSGKVGRNMVVEMGEVEEGAAPPMFFMPGGAQMPQAIKPGLRVDPKAEIGGKLTYVSSLNMSDQIRSAPAGGVVFQTPVPEQKQEAQGGGLSRIERISPVVSWIFKTLRNLITLLLLGGLALWLLPGVLRRLVEQVRTAPASAAGYGALALLVGYAGAFLAGLVILSVGIFLLIVTLGGLGGTVLGIGLSSLAVFVTALGFLVVYGSKLVLAFLGGEWIMRKLAPNASHPYLWAMVVGVVVYVLLRAIPFIGWIFGLLATLLGLGAMYLVYRTWRAERLAAAEQPAG